MRNLYNDIIETAKRKGFNLLPYKDSLDDIKHLIEALDAYDWIEHKISQTSYREGTENFLAEFCSDMIFYAAKAESCRHEVLLVISDVRQICNTSHQKPEHIYVGILENGIVPSTYPDEQAKVNLEIRIEPDSRDPARGLVTLYELRKGDDHENII